jgi:hypothetical protein
MVPSHDVKAPRTVGICGHAVTTRSSPWI